jgi:RNA polymerase sigma factor (sigma-70 family)
MDNEELTQVVAAAGRGEHAAWKTLVARYQPMMRGIARVYRLNNADVEDVCQTVWLQLFKNIDAIVEPRAIAGWLATTTKNAALGVRKGCNKVISVDAALLEDRTDQSWSSVEGGRETAEPDEHLVQAEQRAAVRASLAALSNRQLSLLGLLAADPPLPYVEISQRLGVPIGSIGPTRARSIQRLRQESAIRALV